MNRVLAVLIRIFRPSVLSLLESTLDAALIPVIDQIDGVDEGGGLTAFEREMTDDERAVALSVVATIRARVLSEARKRLSL